MGRALNRILSALRRALADALAPLADEPELEPVLVRVRVDDRRR